MLYSDHEALRFLNSQKKLNSRHGNWVEFLQPYPYVIKHKAGVENKVADALSRRVSILVAISKRLLDLKESRTTMNLVQILERYTSY